MIKAVLAIALLSVLALTISSETLTMTTTYPSPVGVYNYIITTGNAGAAPQNTILARNAGRVGIGTSSPQAPLDVSGEIRSSGGIWLARHDVPRGSCPDGGAYLGRLIVIDGNFSIGDPVLQGCSTGSAYDTHLLYCGTRWNGNRYLYGWVCAD